MIVIPMAGMSRRFTEAGFLKPKFMLDLHGRSLFARSVESFDHYFDKEQFLFIARDEQGVADFIRSELEVLGVREANLVMLPKPTLGQADTVRQGLDRLDGPDDEPLTIFNIDTFRPNFRYPDAEWMAHADGYLEVMHGDDAGFSFVAPALDQNEFRVDFTREKEVISNLASTGLYWFRRRDKFLKYMDDKLFGLDKGEKYIAPLYNIYIKNGQDVRYNIVEADKVIFCGTPDQYYDLLSNKISL